MKQQTNFWSSRILRENAILPQWCHQQAQRADAWGSLNDWQAMACNLVNVPRCYNCHSNRSDKMQHSVIDGRCDVRSTESYIYERMALGPSSFDVNRTEQEFIGFVISCRHDGLRKNDRKVSRIRRTIYTKICPIKNGRVLPASKPFLENQNINSTDILLSNLNPCALCTSAPYMRDHTLQLFKNK